MPSPDFRMVQSRPRIAARATISIHPKDRRPSGADNWVALNLISGALWREAWEFASLNLRSSVVRGVAGVQGEESAASRRQVGPALGRASPRSSWLLHS